jgi:murein L,D-transpeptidase YcbB/YkuD
VTSSAQGIDVSAYQSPLTVSALAGLDFAFTKATDGPGGTDPNFAANWAVIRSAGKHRGTYHELQPGAPSAQAAHFLAVVQARGLEPGDMLACVASDYPASDADVRAFCDSVKAATAGRNPVLVYSDLSVAATLTSCTGYDLWVAWPSATAPASVAPWKTWRLWQWQLTGLDRDAYNGSAAGMSAWVASFTHPPVPPAPSPVPAWQEAMMQALPLVTEGDKDTQAVRTVQGLLCARGHAVTVDGAFGPATLKALVDFQRARGLTADGKCGPSTWPALADVA